MARSRVSVYLDHAAIDRLTLPGGMVNRYVNELAREVFIEALAMAPVLTGRMKASMYLGGGSSNQYGTSERVYVGVKYARYVLQGTYGPIVPKYHEVMPVGKSQGTILFWARQVAGQDANNFLGDALTSVMTRRFV